MCCQVVIGGDELQLENRNESERVDESSQKDFSYGCNLECEVIELYPHESDRTPDGGHIGKYGSVPISRSVV